jgi:hypothetical protein
MDNYTIIKKDELKKDDLHKINERLGVAQEIKIVAVILHFVF